MRLIFGQDEAIIEWVTRRIPWMPPDGFGVATAIGVADDNGHCAAGIVYNDYNPSFGTMAISVAADTPLWAKPDIIYACLSYPFDQMQVWKLWAAMPHTSKHVLRFNEHLGFTKEATLRHHLGRGKHAVIASMLKPEFDKKYVNVRRLAA